MLKKLTTAFGLTLIAGSLALASQAPSTNSNQAATGPATAQATPGNSQEQQATPSKSVKKHRRHHHRHKRQAAPNVTPNGSTPSTPNSSTPRQ
jgi:hypothetical protein